jgi:hypothetical protein
MRQQTTFRHHRLALIVEFANDHRALLRSEIEAMLVGLGHGDLEALSYRLPALARCEPTTHEVGSLAIGRTEPSGPRCGGTNGSSRKHRRLFSRADLPAAYGFRHTLLL